MKAQQEIITLFFNRGAFVRWFDYHREGTAATYGIVECERTDEPGVYYVRDEAGKLHSVHYTKLKLAERL